MKKLFIDTTDNKNVFAKIEIPEGKYVAKSDSKNPRPDSIVNLIEKALKKGNIAIQEIDEINVNEGPGSYTGIKVGVSVANAISFAFGKKINNKKLGQLVEARYE